ncbi:MAG: zinc-ribbon domain-containing protein [Ginsengibacter sp.]
MIARIFFGIKETPIGVDEFLLKCPSCEGYNMADVMVVSKYFHFCWIPFFPIEKDANVICQTCGLKRYGMNFDSKSIDNYEQEKGKFKHPWFTYIGSTIFLLIFVVAIAASIF